MNERHHGVVAAIAVEAVVKLAALLAVGLFVVFDLAGTPAAAFRDAPVSLFNAQGRAGSPSASWPAQQRSACRASSR